MHGLMREGWHLAAMIRLLRHRHTKGAETDRPRLKSPDACSLLYLVHSIGRLDTLDFVGRPQLLAIFGHEAVGEE
jgi:hypothetical protein